MRTPPRKPARPSSDPLAEYRRKRDFAKTPEPSPEDDAAAPAPAELVFVVQRHEARRLHYDVRLQIGGAMASWAVPKGPSFDPKVKRLAVETEDHPMSYNAFEGTIPEGEYGAGDVLLWDRGTYETVPPGREAAQRAKGHLHVRLRGEKLKGGWHVVRTQGTNQWLMIKEEDADADPAYDVVAARPESVGALAASATSHDLAARFGEPCLADAGEVHDPSRWLFELKYDGYRVLAVKSGDGVRLVTRNGNDWTRRFPAIASAVRALRAREVVLDGEACVVDAGGTPSFSKLQKWLGGETAGLDLVYVAFDLLDLEGRDLRPRPLEERRAELARVLEDAPRPISVSTAVEGELPALVAAVRAAGLEGLVAKRKGSPYVPGRSGHWVKLKLERRQECAVVGWVPMKGTRGAMGALVLAVADTPGAPLRYAGRVGTGWDDAFRRAMGARLAAMEVDAPPVPDADVAPGTRWCRPELVVEILFSGWTDDRRARHARFVGLREDKRPEDAVVERPRKRGAPEAAPAIKITNPDKVLYPRDGVTKRDVVAYYTAVAPVLLPHLAGRPLTLQRWPDGIDGEEWYQKNLPPKMPAFVRTVEVEPKKPRIVADRLETLQYLANLAALTLHQGASHAPTLDEPDYFVVDLDPGEATRWRDLVEVAIAVRTLLEALEMPSVVKTTGKRGLHVVVPIAQGPSHAEATAFAEKIGAAVSKVLPGLATIERMKDRRGGKLYVDFLQNGEGKTVVAPYSLRARDGAPVSTPIAWSEVTEALDPSAFSMRAVLDRVERLGDLFAPALRGTARLPRRG